MMKLWDMSRYMGPWPRALAEFLLLIAGGHLIAVYVFEGTELFSPGGLTGCFLYAAAVAVASYRQKRNIRKQSQPTQKANHD